MGYKIYDLDNIYELLENTKQLLILDAHIINRQPQYSSTNYIIIEFQESKDNYKVMTYYRKYSINYFNLSIDDVITWLWDNKDIYNTSQDIIDTYN